MKRPAAVAALVAVVVLLVGGVAHAYWDGADASAPALAVADSLPTGNAPAGVFTAPGTVAISFARAATASGRPVTDYTVNRYATASTTTVSATLACNWPSPGVLSCVDSGVPAGQWYYTSTPKIAGSNWLGAESARSDVVYADSTAPTISVTAITPNAAGGGLYAASPVTVSLAATDEAGGSGVAGITYQLDNANPVTVGTATASVPISGDGSHTLNYKTTDKAGNVSATGSQVVTIDTTPPNAPTVTSYPAVVNRANQASVAVSGTAEAGATVSVQIADAGSAHTVTRTATAAGDGTWSAVGIDVSALSDGAIGYRVTASDVAGNTGGAATASGTKDTVAPTVAITTATDPVNAAATTASASGTAETGSAVTVSISDGTTTVKPTVSATSGSWSAGPVSIAGLADGTFSYTVTATDAAGNIATASRTAVKDTVAPTATVVIGAGNGSAGVIRSGAGYYVYAQASDAAPGMLSTVRANVGVLTSGQTAVPLAGTGPYVLRGVSYAYRSALLTAGTLTAGTKSVTLTATDAAGNASTVSGSVTVDATAPTATSITATNKAGGTAGKPEAGDVITMRWSEEMDPATLYTGWAVDSTADVAGTVQFSDIAGGSGTNKDTDTVAVTVPTGARLGLINGLNGNLVPTPNNNYRFNATLHYSLVGGESVVTVTLGTLAGGSTVGQIPSNSTVIGLWTPTSTNTDLATNPVTGTANLAALPF